MMIRGGNGLEQSISKVKIGDSGSSGLHYRGIGRDRAFPGMYYSGDGAGPGEA